MLALAPTTGQRIWRRVGGTVSPRCGLALLPLALLVGAGCSGSGSDGAKPRPARGTINETDGAYAGVRLGDPKAAALRQLGPPARPQPRHEGTGPNPYAGEDGPEFVPAGINPDIPGATAADVVVYRDVEVAFDKRRVTAMLVYGRGARTLRGVTLGDSLVSARGRYPPQGTTCRPSASGHGWRISEHCEVSLGRICVYFGGDPITIIAISTETFEIEKDQHPRPKCRVGHVVAES